MRRMIIVHHLENSRSQRVLWLLEELAVPYEVMRYKRHPKTSLAPPELARVHPLGKSPVISDGAVDGGTVVAESGAIVEYLIDVYGAGRLRPPQGSAEQRLYTYWLHFSEGSLTPPLVLKLVFDKVREARVPFFIKPVVRGIADKVTAGYIGPNIKRLLSFMEAELSSRPWFAGSAFSAADVQMSYPVEGLAESGELGTQHPALVDWLQRIHARPAYIKALAAGGPYSALP